MPMIRGLNLGGVQIDRVPQVQRKLRSPQHPFQILHRPWMITPFLIAPVLPGETLKNFHLQARVVSDPVADKMTGWWIEYYFFYVKHRDLPGRADYVDMMLDNAKSMAAYQMAANTLYYEQADTSQLGWVGPCLQRVTEEYFRDEDEAWNNVTMAQTASGAGVVPVAKINQRAWFHSTIDATLLPTGGAFPVDAGSPTYETVLKGMEVYQMLLAQGLTDMSYEDYLSTFGVKLSPEDTHRPELLRYVREWSYPTNTIDPTSGVARSALSWSISERADKDRFFKEPGFIFGVTVARPKAYISKQSNHASGMLSGQLQWLPAVMRDEPFTSLVQYTNAQGPLKGGGLTNGYWVDVRDLFLYGDQFVNVSAAAQKSLVALPTAAHQKKYPSATDAANLFVTTADPGTGGTSYYVRQDGMVGLHILGTQVDQTPVGQAFGARSGAGSSGGG